MKHGISAGLRRSLVLPLFLAGGWVLAGFSGTDLFVPMAGRQAGVHPSNWYTMLWIHNPGEFDAMARVYFLERNASNPAPPYVDITVAAGDTEKLDNVVEIYFHVQAFGALRVTCATQKLVVTSRVYSKATGGSDNDSVGQDFAAVPASFAIGLGEKTRILGVYQTLPPASSTFRFNFGFVETTGHNVTVRVRVYDENGGLDDEKDFQVREFSQRQFAVKDNFQNVSTENARLEVEVKSGSGKVIAYGSGIANGSLVSGSRNTAAGTFALESLVAGNSNAAFGYSALHAHTGTEASAFGANALAANTTGFANSAFGSSALAANTEGENNSALGRFALKHNTTGSLNCAFGSAALDANLTGRNNTAVGAYALNANTEGRFNTALGSNALNGNTAGEGNTAAGLSSLYTNVSGNENTALGRVALFGITSGSRNVGIGVEAGKTLQTGSDNVYIAAQASATDEVGTVRIGTADIHQRTFISGVRGVTTANADAIPVVIDSAGQLGTISSSARVKHDVRDIGASAAALLGLRPVTFRYNAAPAAVHFGLIAEEVAQVLPELVVVGADGRPETVAYHELAAVLLALVQHQQAHIAELEQRLAAVEAKSIDA